MVVIDNWCLEYNSADQEHAKGHTIVKDSYRKKVWICAFCYQLIVIVVFKYNSMTVGIVIIRVTMVLMIIIKSVLMYT